MSRKTQRNEKDERNKSRRILSPDEVEAEVERQQRDKELAALAEEAERNRQQRRTEKATRKAEDEDDNDDDESWEDATSSEEGEFIEDDDDGMEEIVEESEDDDDDDEGYAELQGEAQAEGMTAAMKRVTFADNEAAEDGEGKEDAAPTTMVWRNDQGDTLNEASEKLSYSNKAYDSFFQLRTEYPCLSFDVLHDNEGANRTRYPLTMYFVCGSQADEKNKNQLYVIKVSNILRTKHDVDSDEDSDEDVIGANGSDSEDDEDAEEANNGEPMVDYRTIKHHGTANRVRCSHHNKSLCAVWSDAGHVQLFQLQNDFTALADHANWAKEQAKNWNKTTKSNPLVFCTPSSAHQTEGYGLDWSSVQTDVFASGDCNGDLVVWKPTEDGRWSAASSAKGRQSIEEIKWSPVQPDVLMCGRAGGMIEVWDTRDMRKSQLSWRADELDINVMDWNRVRQASHLLVSGADSGIVAVWDLRHAKSAKPTPIQSLTWHKKRITSVEFSLLNESVLAVSGDDGQATLWDLSLERDASEEKEVVGELFERKDLVQIPDQLMFQHQGLQHPKELHWHNQVPGMVVTTDFNGLHLFKPMNWRSLMK